MESGGLEAWLKKEGDELAPGDVLAHVTTDKATVDFECQDDGYLAKILLPEGSENVTVGTPVAIVVENEEDIAAFKDINVDEFVKSAGEGSSASAPLARDNGLDIAQLKGKGSGPHGRIVAADVEEYLKSGAPKQAEAQGAAATGEQRTAAAPAGAPAAGDYEDIPVSSMRRTIANRLTDSKRAVPHYYLTSEITIDALLKLRKQDAKLSLNDFIVKAAAIAMKSVPEVNSSWQNDFIRRYKNVDINVAVAVPD
ncbi:unnamed protein product, partial [Symbiodinium sp. KB8]